MFSKSSRQIIQLPDLSCLTHTSLFNFLQFILYCLVLILASFNCCFHLPKFSQVLLISFVSVFMDYAFHLLTLFLILLMQLIRHYVLFSSFLVKLGNMKFKNIFTAMSGVTILFLHETTNVTNI